MIRNIGVSEFSNRKIKIYSKLSQIIFPNPIPKIPLLKLTSLIFFVPYNQKLVS